MALFRLEGQAHKGRLQHVAFVTPGHPQVPQRAGLLLSVMGQGSPMLRVSFGEIVCVLAKNMSAGCLGFQSWYGHLLCDFE